MEKTLVYDWPTRLFHWLFAGLFIVAFLIAKTVDDESPTYAYHMLAGLMLGAVVVLRIIWGIVGTKHARFASFALHPRELAAYFGGVLSGSRRKWAGHNPASSWAALVMMGLALGLAGTGILMAQGYKESLEDVHELLATAFLIVVLFHVAGVVLHALRHQDGIALSMVHGAKGDISQGESIPSSRPVMGMVFVAFAATFALHLAKNFDRQSQTLNLFGTTLQLGESEGNEHDEGRSEHEGAAEGHGDDDGDDD